MITIMEKKQYIIPLVEVQRLGVCELMITGSASVLPGPGSAPKRRVPALGNDSVTVF